MTVPASGPPVSGPDGGDDPSRLPVRPGTALFDLEAVSLVVAGRPVIDEVTLTVEEGGITVVVGPSGSGKTTLLRLLNRLEVPTAGQIRFRGVPLDSLDPLVLRRRVGMVFQRPAPFPGSVRDNLLVADPTAGNGYLSAALGAAGLADTFLDRSADDLSGGETQRLCLARTLVTEPEVLLMDEPTAALDRQASHHLETTVRGLAGEGRPVLWVTHDLAQAGRLADRTVVLVEGHLATGPERDRYLVGRHLPGQDPQGDDRRDEEGSPDG